MNHLRVLYLFPFGGLEPKRSSHVMGRGFLQGLIKRWHKVYVVPSSKDEWELAKLLDLHAFDVGNDSVITRVIKRGLFVCYRSRRINQLAELVRTNKVDVIFERHSLYNTGYYVSKLTGIPYVTNEVIVHPDLPYYGTTVDRIQLKVLPRWYYMLVEGKVFRHASAVVAFKQKYIDTLIHEYGVKPERIFRFYAMVDKDRFKPREKKEACEQLGLDPSLFRVAYVGSFDKLHTPEYLVPVIQRISEADIQFLLVGDGPRLSVMKEMLRNYIPCGKVIFTGRVEHEKVIKYIQAADVCIESIWNERVRKFGADSTKIYEYMACGKPIVASDLPGQVQELGIEKAAILVNPTDPEEFVSAIRELYTNRALREEMGRKARQLVEDKWNWEYTMVVLEEALYFAVNYRA
ncbi:MAG: glycosyltransferase family 4 protein [candidate division WOR-3 bacterium]